MVDSWIKKYRLFFLLMLVNGVRCQLENEDVIIGVYLDNSRVMGFKEVTEKMIRSVAETASAAMDKGSMSVRLLNNLREGNAKDLFGVVVVCQCDDAHEMAQELDGEKFMVAITDAGCKRIQRSSTITIPLVSGDNDIVQLISDLRSKNTLIWNDIIVISDGLVDQTTEILEILSRPIANNKQTSLLVMDISKFDSVTNGLKKVFGDLGPQPGEPRKRQFIALISKENVNNVQIIAKEKKLTGPNYQWLFVIPDTQSLNYDMTKYLGNVMDGDNVAFAYNMSIQNPTSNCNNGYDCILDQMLSEIAKQISNSLSTEIELFNQVSAEEWDEIKPTQGQRASTIINTIMKQIESMPTCTICNQWGIESVEIMDKDKFNLLAVADWRPSGGLMLFDDIFPHITGGFRGRIIKVASLDYPPFQIFPKNKNGGQYSGLIFKILTEIGIKLNFTFAVSEPADGKWGVKDANGNFNGMIKMVQDKEVLLGAAAFTVSQERMSAINFTATLDKEPYTYMIARPQELSRVLIFIEPFANDTWLWIGITVMVMGPILYLIHSSSPYYDFHGTRNDRGLFSLQNCAWYCYGAILQQGGNNLPNATSGRLLVSFWWIFVTVVVTTYSGNLVAFLTFPQLENSVSTLQDLLDNRHTMTWGYVRGTVLTNYFKTAKGKYLEIGEEAIVYDKTDNALLREVRQKDHAFIEWKNNLLFLMEREYNTTNLCEYSLGKEEFYFENVGMILPRDSPYKPTFDVEIERLLETGLLEKWKSDFLPQRNKCSVTAYGMDFAMRTVSMTDMQGSFILLVFGFIGALVVAITECFSLLCKNKSLPSASSTRTLVKSMVA